jgi:hypothetical protein
MLNPPDAVSCTEYYELKLGVALGATANRDVGIRLVNVLEVRECSEIDKDPVIAWYSSELLKTNVRATIARVGCELADGPLRLICLSMGNGKLLLAYLSVF